MGTRGILPHKLWVGNLNKIIKIFKNNWFFGTFTCLFLTLNVRNLFFGKPIYDEYDSAAYFTFKLYPAFRMQIITLIYDFVNNERLIIVFQVLISTLVFISLATALYASVQNAIVKSSAILLTYLFGISSVVTEQNYILKSESLNNSALILVISSLIFYLKSKSSKNFVIVLMSIIFLSGTKAVSSVSGAILLTLFLFIFLKNHIKSYQIIILTFLSLIVCGFFIASALSSDVSKIYTTSSIINERLWTNPVWKKDALDNGYPSESYRIWSEHRETNRGLPPDQAVINSKEFLIWWPKDGKNYLNSFMFRNLDYTFLGPVCLPCLNNNYNFRATIWSGLSQGTDEIRNIKLQDIYSFRTLFWPDEPEKAYVVVVAFLLSIFVFNTMAVFASSKTLIDKLYIIYIIMAYLFTYSYISWWLGSKENDMNRHQLNSAIALRVVVVYIVVLLLDDVVSKALQIDKLQKFIYSINGKLRYIKNHG
jgi:hypothetical protein